MDVQRGEHPLCLKVMRLSPPSFHLTSTPVVFGGDVFASIPPPVDGILPSSVQPQAEPHDIFPITSSYALPERMRDIHLGEDFRCYISLSSQSLTPVGIRQLKAELRTADKRFVLLEEEGGAVETAASRDVIISHVMGDVGEHMLLVTCIYLDSLGTERVFTKKFRFNVSNPLEVSWTMHTLNCTVMVETRIKNTTKMPLTLSRVALNTTMLEGANMIAVPTAPLLERSVGFYSSSSLQWAHIAQGDVVKVVHSVMVPPAMPNGAEVGHLSIEWAAGGGVCGTINYAPLRFQNPSSAPITVTPVDCPCFATEGVPLPLRLRITNRTGVTTTLQLHFSVDRSDGILFSGMSGVVLPPIAPSASLDHDLVLLPVRTGLHEVIGLRVFNATTGGTLVVGSLASLFVLPHPTVIDETDERRSVAVS